MVGKGCVANLCDDTVPENLGLWERLLRLHECNTRGKDIGVTGPQVRYLMSTPELTTRGAGIVAWYSPQSFSRRGHLASFSSRLLTRKGYIGEYGGRLR
jgi:hypothetical protein